MSLIESSAILRAMAEKPEAFSAIHADIDLMVSKLFVKQIKKITTAQQLMTLSAVVGRGPISGTLDSFAPNEIAGLIKRVDPHSQFVRADASRGREARAHLLGLADGSIGFSAAPAKIEKKMAAPKKPAGPKPKIGTILESKVHAGTVRRKAAPK